MALGQPSFVGGAPPSPTPMSGTTPMNRAADPNRRPQVPMNAGVQNSTPSPTAPTMASTNAPAPITTPII